MQFSVKTMIVRTCTLAKQNKPLQSACTNTGCGDSAVYQHLDSTKHSFNNKDIIIQDRKHKDDTKGVKEAIYVSREQPSLNYRGRPTLQSGRGL